MRAPVDITCGEIGAPDASRWSEAVAIARDERDTLESLAARGVLDIRATGDGVRVAGLDQVGTVALPGGRLVHVRPKIGRLVLLDWLAYVGDLPPVADWARGGDAGAGGSVPSMMAELLLRELAALSCRPLREAFAEVRRDGGAVRGRVLAGALGRSAHRLPGLPHAYRARTLDTPHNRVLAAALDRLGALLERDSPALGETYSRVRDEWSTVRRDGTQDPARLVADARGACPAGYERAVGLAAAVLAGCTGPRAAGAPGGTFLLSLSGIWERALRRMCEELQDATGWSPLPDARRTRRWHDGQGLASPVRWMTADVLLESGARRWVLDAKYKRDFGREDRNDRFQATAYALAFDARRGTLVYPTAEGPAPRSRLLLAGRVSRDRVTIDSVELPMAAGPSACRRALLDVIQSGDPTPSGHHQPVEPTLFDDL